MKGLIKICGLAGAVDVEETLAAGPDAVGFVFWPKSPRAVTPEQVRDWTGRPGSVPVRKVGVFVDTPVDGIHRTVETAGLDVVQLHGPYAAEEIDRIRMPVWRVLHLDRMPDDWKTCRVEALLVDSGTAAMPGGTGVGVDAGRAREVVKESPFPVLLAGGLKADNVADVIKNVSPGGVDVSSGVEIRPGKKNPDAVKTFIRNARSAFSS